MARVSCSRCAATGSKCDKKVAAKQPMGKHDVTHDLPARAPGQFWQSAAGQACARLRLRLRLRNCSARQQRGKGRVAQPVDDAVGQAVDVGGAAHKSNASQPQRAAKYTPPRPPAVHLRLQVHRIQHALRAYAERRQLGQGGGIKAGVFVEIFVLWVHVVDYNQWRSCVRASGGASGDVRASVCVPSLAWSSRRWASSASSSQP